MVAEKNSRRVVLLPFADDDITADVHKIEHAVNRIASRAVRLFLFPATEPRDGIERGIFRCAHEFEFDRALGVH